MKSIIAAFPDLGNAQNAMNELRSTGYETKKLELIEDPNESSRLNDLLLDREVPRDRAELYCEVERRGAPVLICDAEDERASEIAAIFDRNGALDIEHAKERWSAQGWTGYSAEAEPLDEQQLATERDHMRESLAVVEEEVRVGKREIPGESVRVRTFVTERPVHEEVTLREEHIEVNREPVNEPVPAGTADATFTEEEFVVTTTAEQPVVEKQARVVERVNIEKEAETHTETIDETERRRDVEVERLASEQQPPPARR
jgi:stress response protein YsnF